MIRSGFYNSIGADRTYSAEDMTKPYELLVSNGVFATPEGTPSDYLQVYENSGMTVTVKTGYGMFKNKWFVNDADLPLTLDAAEVTYGRIDSIIVKVDTSEAVRDATIEVKKGTPATSPVAPTMTRTDTVYEYRLADITIPANSASIDQLNIKDQRGSADCGWVTSLIQQVDTSTLWIQYESEFVKWFDTLKDTMATATLIRSYTSAYTTTVQDETVIPINISQYNSPLDILQVYVNGLMMVRDVDYTMGVSPVESITLTSGVDAGTTVSFVVYKSVDGSDAETVVSQVADLETATSNLQTTMDTVMDTYLPLSGGKVTGDLDVEGVIRSKDMQVAFTDGVNVMQFGTANLPTRINAKDDIYLSTRCQTASLIPTTTGAYQLGNASYRYSGIYLVNTPNVSSDARLKTDVTSVDIDSMMEMVSKLRVVDFRFLTDPKELRMGLIAQEVEEAGGDRFVEISETGTYGLKPMDLVYPLIASVQVLSRENAELKARLDAVEAKLQG